jgi:hypothetical protein
MIGSGSVVFAVWPYVIANMRADREVGAQVDLNPKLLAAIIGEKEALIEEAIGKLCAPDPSSTSKVDEGRRLVRVGQFAYRVVNGANYMAIRDLEHKRQYDREQKRKQRAGKGHKALTNEVAAVRAMGNGQEGLADQLAAETSAFPKSELQRQVAADLAKPQAVPAVAAAAVPAAVLEQKPRLVTIEEALRRGKPAGPMPIATPFGGWAETDKKIPPGAKSP